MLSTFRLPRTDWTTSCRGGRGAKARFGPGDPAGAKEPWENPKATLADPRELRMGLGLHPLAGILQTRPGHLRGFFQTLKLGTRLLLDSNNLLSDYRLVT